MPVLDVPNWNAWADKRSQGRWCHLHEQNGWIYGYWVCGRPHGRSTRYYGEYPHSFLERALSLFAGVDTTQVLHAPSGILTKEDVLGGVTVDIAFDDPFDLDNPPNAGQRVPRRPEFVADVVALPFEDESFQVVLSDPPYSHGAYNGGKKYDRHVFPTQKALDEFWRVLEPGGYLGWLHVLTGPQASKKKWKRRAIIAVAPSTVNNITRTFSVFQKVIPRETLFTEEV